MRLLVTGGSGFLGSYVLDEARRRGHETVALARSEKAAAAAASRGAQPLTGDFDDPAGLCRVFSSARCSSLLNIASLGFGHAPAILAGAKAAGIDRAVFVSTTAVTTRLVQRLAEDKAFSVDDAARDLGDAPRPCTEGSAVGQAQEPST